MVEQASRNACHKCLFPLDELHLAPASQGGSPRSAGGSNQGSFWITALALRPRTYEVLCAPFKNGVSFPQRSDSSECTLCWPSRANVVGFVFPVQDFQFGEPQLEVCGVQIPCSLGRTSEVVIILPFVGHPCGGIVLNCTASLSLLLVWLRFLYVFSCRRSSLLAFWSFSSILAL